MNDSAQRSNPGTPAVRVILADSQAIYRVGISKIFAQQPGIDVVAQAETMAQALSAVSRLEADVALFEERLSPTPADAVAELLRRAPGLKLVVLTSEPNEKDTVEFLKRGARGIVTRAISPELLARCVRCVASGELWLDNKGVNWIISAYRAQSALLAEHGGPQLTQKELIIATGVAQGLRNKDIAQQIGTTEQVVKNYLRRIYSKVGVADRLELALYCVHQRLLESPPPESPTTAAAAGVAASLDPPPSNDGG